MWSRRHTSWGSIPAFTTQPNGSVCAKPEKGRQSTVISAKMSERNALLESRFIEEYVRMEMRFG